MACLGVAILGMLTTLAHGADAPKAADKAAAKPPKVEVALWLRKPQTKPGDPARGNVRTLDLGGLTWDELETTDVQYGGKFRFRGLHLRDLITIYKPLPPTVDLILLHTANGMIVPVALADLRKNREVFIALEVKRDGAWSTDFPASIRPDPNVKDEKPLVFAGSKLVVGTNWRHTRNEFTPWRHVTSVTGIEFAESVPYYERLTAGSGKEAGLGRAVYAGRCLFCHAVAGEGAGFGPSLTDVAAVSDKDGWKTLLDKVKVPKDRAYQLAHAMPKQKDFTRAEAKAIWTWLGKAKAGISGSYAPTYAAGFTWEP